MNIAFIFMTYVIFKVFAFVEINKLLKRTNKNA